MGGLALPALSQRDQNGGEDSPFGGTPCHSRGGDTEGHPLGKLDPKPQSRDLGPQGVAVGSRGGVSPEQAGLGQSGVPGLNPGRWGACVSCAGAL